MAEMQKMLVGFTFSIALQDRPRLISETMAAAHLIRQGTPSSAAICTAQATHR